MAEKGERAVLRDVVGPWLKYATSRGVMRFGDGSSARQGKVREPRTSSQGKVSQAKAARDAHPSQVKLSQVKVVLE